MILEYVPFQKHYLGREEKEPPIFTESHVSEALNAVGSGGPDLDLLLVYGPARCHLGFPPWRIRYFFRGCPGLSSVVFLCFNLAVIADSSGESRNFIRALLASRSLRGALWFVGDQFFPGSCRSLESSVGVLLWIFGVFLAGVGSGFGRWLHMGPLKSMKYGSLIKAMWKFSMVRQNYDFETLFDRQPLLPLIIIKENDELHLGDQKHRLWGNVQHLPN
ncbi:hypothetical protein CsSME_00009434 [Camellia sinensis var. sinensis]